MVYCQVCAPGRNFSCYTSSIGCHDFSKIAGNLFESCPAAKYNKTSKTCFEVLVFVRRDGVGSTLMYGVGIEKAVLQMAYSI